MKEYRLSNGIKLIYKKSMSELSSISIALDAGAGRDFKDKFGIAHATEHMIYKGTKSRTEDEINSELSAIFGFQNAMTNYPYVIYYGTLLSEDLKQGIDLFADILINPTFNEEGFLEEMNVIKEELNEWDEDLEQYCEDKLLMNFYKGNRKKYPIIGTEESLMNITLDDIRRFYSTYYYPGNMTITIISNCEFESVISFVDSAFCQWNNEGITLDKEKVDVVEGEILIDTNRNSNTAKVMVDFQIDKLSIDEIKTLKLFNQWFGEGINSLLFDTLRTKNGLVYDVLTRVSNENYINLYKITFSTSKEKVNDAISIVNELIRDLDIKIAEINEDKKVELIKSLKLKRLFGEEQSIRLANVLSTYDSMFGDYKIYLNEIIDLEEIDNSEIINVVRKVMKNPMIQVVG